LLAATFFLLPSGTSAQGSGQGFLFKQPTVQVGLHGGYTIAHASGPVLDFARNELTLNKRDFDASTWGLELAVRAQERLDIAFDVRFSRSEAGSEMREWVDQDNLPIQQTTSLVRVPVTVSTKFYLRDRGRAISRFAWVPAKWAPFVGAGGGFLWYQFEQKGDFVDIATLDVVNFTLESSGWTPTGHVFAGVDISLSPRFLWTLEGRYAFGGATTGSAFNFDDLDLSGFQATLGLAVRF
jgi:hypothetical protein